MKRKNSTITIYTYRLIKENVGIDLRKQKKPFKTVFSKYNKVSKVTLYPNEYIVEMKPGETLTMGEKRMIGAELAKISSLGTYVTVYFYQSNNKQCRSGQLFRLAGMSVENIAA